MWGLCLPAEIAKGVAQHGFEGFHTRRAGPGEHQDGSRIRRWPQEKGSGDVDLFLSTFENRIDRKGRLSVPAPFRAVLERRHDPLYLFKSLTEPCLEGCGPERIGQIVDAIDSMDSLSAEVATLQTMLSSAQEMKVDGEGRIMLSADFIAFVELGDMALYAGIGRSFQIWLPERYRARETEARSRAKTEGMPSLRLGAGRRPPDDTPSGSGGMR